MSMPAGLPNSEVQANLEAWLDNVDLDGSENTEDPERTPDAEDNPAELKGEDDPELLDDPTEDPEEGEEEVQDPLAAEAETEEGETEEGENISSLAALAEYFEVEEDDVLSNLEVEDPFGNAIPIGEALNSWRETEGMLEHRRAELENRYAAQVEQQNTEIEKNLAELHTLSRALIEHIKGDYSDERMQRVRMEDPDGYADMLDRRNAMLNVIDNASKTYQMNAELLQKQSQQDMDKLLREENATLLRKKPEWADPKVRQNDMIAGQRLLQSLGWSQEDIDSVVDHRILILTDLAVKGARLSKDASKKNVEELRKRGLKKPSIGLRTKSRKDPENPANKARAQARAKLRKSGDARDAARLVEDLI